MIVGQHLLDRRLEYTKHKIHLFEGTALVWLVIMRMFVGIRIEANICAFLYLLNPAITTLPDAQTAFYFSLVTYTTLGHGDLVLSGDWRVKSPIQAANGANIFGWTTALIYYFIQRIYKAAEVSRKSK